MHYKNILMLFKAFEYTQNQVNTIYDIKFLKCERDEWGVERVTIVPYSRGWL